MEPECPRCPTPLVEEDGVRVCPLHGTTDPLWRTVEAGYDSLMEHLTLAGAMPSWTPWPLPAGWTVSDFGAVRADGENGAVLATMATCGGLTDTDGHVSLTVVSEEPGVGLGARVAGVVHDDPGSQTQGRPVQTRVRVGGVTVPLWLVSTTVEGVAGQEAEQPWDRAVLVGEAQGRWLWLVITPASAALGLGAWGPMEDLGGHGPELLELGFGPRTGDW